MTIKNNRGIREQGRELAFLSVYTYDLAKASLSELLETNWYEKMEAFGDEGGELFFIEPGIKNDVLDFYRLVLNGTVSNLPRIDEIIKAHLVKWTFERLHAVDKAILRISIYSLLYQLDVPSEVIISEANELSEKYSGDNTSNYINGILHRVKEEQRKGMPSPQDSTSKSTSTTPGKKKIKVIKKKKDI